MPQVTAEAHVPVDPATAFAVSQTTGELRLRWDPFIRHQHFVDGATAPGKGVRTLTRARVGPEMVSEYVSYRPPTSVGMTMVEGPWYFDSFGGGWRFVPDGERHPRDLEVHLRRPAVLAAPARRADRAVAARS